MINNILGSIRINKLSMSHSEKLSDSMIVNNIINLTDAKKNLSSSDYKEAYRIYLKYAEEKEEILCNKEEYFQRAFCIAYEFERFCGYKKVCGDAEEIEQFVEMAKEKFEINAEKICDDFMGKTLKVVELCRDKEKEKVVLALLDSCCLYAYGVGFVKDFLGHSIIDKYCYTIAFIRYRRQIFELFEAWGWAKEEIEPYLDARMDKWDTEVESFNCDENSVSIKKYYLILVSNYLNLCGVCSNALLKEYDALLDEWKNRMN